MKSKPNIDPNRFYVYGHYTLDGNLFYVGKGTARRAWFKSERPLKWDEVANKGYSVKLLHENLTEDKALELEVELINSEKKVNPFLLNKRSTNNRIELDYESKEQAFVACKDYKESIRDILLLTGIPERVIDYGS